MLEVNAKRRDGEPRRLEIPRLRFHQHAVMVPENERFHVPIGSERASPLVRWYKSLPPVFLNE